MSVSKSNGSTIKKPTPLMVRARIGRKSTSAVSADRGRIKSALSLLAAQGLVHVEHTKSFKSGYGIANAYRLAFIEPRVHMGTYGRGMDEVEM
jgi:hypothetical protein